MEMTTAWPEQSEERIGELEIKLWKKKLRKRDKKIQEYEGKIRELSDALKRNNLHIEAHSFPTRRSSDL